MTHLGHLSLRSLLCDFLVQVRAHCFCDITRRHALVISFCSAFILAVACYGLNEQDVPNELKKNFDKDKLIIPVSNHFGEAFYANVTMRAFIAVMQSLAEER